MNHISKLVVVLCLLAGCDLSANATASVGKTGDPIKIKLIIHHGKKGCCPCFALRVCDMHIILENPDPASSGDNYTIGRLVNTDGRLYLEFNRTEMTQKCFDQYFSTGKYILEEDFVFPEEVSARAGIPALTLRAGAYPLEVSPGDANVLFIRL